MSMAMADGFGRLLTKDSHEQMRYAMRVMVERGIIGDARCEHALLFSRAHT